MGEPQLTDQEWSLFRRLVDERSGIHLPPSRRLHLEQAVARAVGGGFEDTLSLYRHLTSPAGRPELEDLVASLTVGETHFFRNKPQVQALEDHVLPFLIRRRSDQKRLRIWSAGCSTGEEAYTVAMLLDRLLSAAEAWNITILGTDIDREALARARAARFRSWSFRGVPEELRSRYFEPRGDALELVPRIREMVTFEYLNLVEDVYPSLVNNTNAMDLVICRNVLIYFRQDTARAVIERLQRSMVGDAWLFLGHAEPSHWVGSGLSLHSFAGAVAYHRSEPESPEPGPMPPPRRPLPPPRPAASERRVAHRRGPDRRKRKPRPPAEPVAAAPAPDDACHAALELLEAGDAEPALARLEVLVNDHPRDPRPAYLIAKHFAGTLAVEQAEMWARIALERDRLFAPAYHLQGLIASEDGRTEDAIAAFRRCIYAAPDWELGYFTLATVLLRGGQRAKARAAFANVERLLADASEDRPIWEGDGVTAGRLGELTQMQLQISGLGGDNGT